MNSCGGANAHFWFGFLSSTQCTALLPVQFQCPNSTLLSITWWRLETSRKLNYSGCVKDTLISEKKNHFGSNLQKKVPNHDPGHFLLRWIVLIGFDLAPFLEIKPLLVIVSWFIWHTSLHGCSVLFCHFSVSRLSREPFNPS